MEAHGGGGGGVDKVKVTSHIVVVAAYLAANVHSENTF